MGTSSDGVLCFGIDFGEDYEFPWDNYKGDDSDEEGDIDDWWMIQSGYIPSVEIYNKEGELIEGVTTETEDEYWGHRRKFQEQNPLPVDLALYCSYDYPMYILAVKGTQSSACRGEVVEIENLDVDHDSKKTLEDFCDKYLDLDADKIPKWYLCSLYG